MKNLFLSLLFFALLTMSCGNKTKTAETQEETKTETVAPVAEEVAPAAEEVAPDSTAVTEETAATEDSTATAQ